MTFIAAAPGYYKVTFPFPVLVAPYLERVINDLYDNPRCRDAVVAWQIIADGVRPICLDDRDKWAGKDWRCAILRPDGVVVAQSGYSWASLEAWAGYLLEEWQAWYKKNSGDVAARARSHSAMTGIQTDVTKATG